MPVLIPRQGKHAFLEQLSCARIYKKNVRNSSCPLRAHNLIEQMTTVTQYKRHTRKSMRQGIHKFSEKRESRVANLGARSTVFLPTLKCGHQVLNSLEGLGEMYRAAGSRRRKTLSVVRGEKGICAFLVSCSNRRLCEVVHLYNAV